MSKRLLEGRETKPLEQLQSDLDRINNLVSAIKGLIPQPAPVAQPAAPSPGDQVALVRELVGLLRQLMPAPAAAPPPNPIEQLRQLLELVHQARELVAPASQPAIDAEGLSFGQRLLLALAPHSDRIVAALGPLLAGWQARPGWPQTPSAPAQPEAQTPPTAASGDQQLRELLLRYMPQLVAGFNSEDPRAAGEEMAASICTLLGEAAYYQLALVPKQTWLELLASLPVWGELERIKDRVEAYLEGFLSWGASLRV